MSTNSGEYDEGEIRIEKDNSLFLTVKIPFQLKQITAKKITKVPFMSSMVFVQMKRPEAETSLASKEIKL